MKKWKLTLYTLLFAVCMAFNLAPGIVAEAAYNEDYPDIAFFSSPELNSGNLIGNNDICFNIYPGAANEFYLYLNDTDENYTLNLADGIQKDEDEGKEITLYPFTAYDSVDWDSPITGTSSGVENYFSVTPVSGKEDWYKITIDPSVERFFTIRAISWKANKENPTDAWRSEAWIDIRPCPVGLNAARRDTPDELDTAVFGEVYPKTIDFSLYNTIVSSTENGVSSTLLTDLNKITIQRINWDENGDTFEEIDKNIYDIKTIESKYISLAFKEQGNYMLTYDGIEGGIMVGAYLPTLGFYSTATRSDEDITNFLGYELSYKEAQPATIYMLSWTGEGSPLLTDSIKINAYSENGSLLSDYISTEKLGNGNYKITTTSKATGTFKVVVTARMNWNPENPDDVSEEKQEIQFNCIPATKKPQSTPAPKLKVGDTKVISGNTYQITATGAGKKEVAYKSAKKNAKKVTIPASVTIDGSVYKVTEISANALKGCKKAKTITIKSKNIKKIGKNAFKGISKKATIKVPKNKKKAYTKLLKKAGFKGKVK